MIQTAMLLAAGRGKRMRPLTDKIPKPLLEVAGKPLIQYHLEALSQANIKHIIINHAWLGEQIVETLGNGEQFGVSIEYSDEPETLETGGGIYNALPLLGELPFLVINSDIWCDIEINKLQLPAGKLAHLIMVDNPEQHPEGDFHLEDGIISETEADNLTFSGIGIYHPDLFKECEAKRFSLVEPLRRAMQKNAVSGEYFKGQWRDIGTVERLQQIEQQLTNGARI